MGNNNNSSSKPFQKEDVISIQQKKHICKIYMYLDNQLNGLSNNSNLPENPSIILDEDIDSLREEQELKIQKNDDLYEKYIEEEVSDFKIFGYSNSSPKELEILKNKIKCEIYNDIYKILDKK